MELREAEVLQQRTADVKLALDQHVYWDKFFTQLEAVTLPTTTYTTMSADTSGTVTLTAQSTSYDGVGNQLLAFQQNKDFITDVTINTATMQSASTSSIIGSSTSPSSSNAASSIVTFSVALQVNVSIFYKH